MRSLNSSVHDGKQHNNTKAVLTVLPYILFSSALRRCLVGASHATCTALTSCLRQISRMLWTAY